MRSTTANSPTMRQGRIMAVLGVVALLGVTGTEPARAQVVPLVTEPPAACDGPASCVVDVDVPVPAGVVVPGGERPGTRVRFVLPPGYSVADARGRQPRLAVLAAGAAGRAARDARGRLDVHGSEPGRPGGDRDGGPPSRSDRCRPGGGTQPVGDTPRHGHGHTGDRRRGVGGSRRRRPVGDGRSDTSALTSAPEIGRFGTLVPWGGDDRPCARDGVEPHDVRVPLTAARRARHTPRSCPR